MTKTTTRRAVLASGAAASLFAGRASAGGESAKALPSVRRIVTGEGPDGTSVELFSDSPTNAVTLNGSTITRLWETGPIPTDLKVTEDKGATAGNAYRPGFAGTSLYTADIPSGTSLADIPMHAQDSFDYIAIQQGQIDLILESGRVTMQAGDILVQAGNLHSWENPYDGPCRMLVVVMTASRQTG